MSKIRGTLQFGDGEGNGEARGDVTLFEAESQYGTLSWGKRPEGFTGWAWKEAGGGGAVTIPYSHSPTGELLVGLINETRKNMGGERLCIIGGFVSLPETHQVAQTREAQEEAEIDSHEAVQIGLPQNGNRLYFVADPHNGEGIHIHALEVPHNQLSGDKLLEAEGKLGKAIFLPWRKAMLELCGDLIATSAMGILKAHLEEREDKKDLT